MHKWRTILVLTMGLWLLVTFSLQSSSPAQAATGCSISLNNVSSTSVRQVDHQQTSMVSADGGTIRLEIPAYTFASDVRVAIGQATGVSSPSQGVLASPVYTIRFFDANCQQVTPQYPFQITIQASDPGAPGSPGIGRFNQSWTYLGRTQLSSSNQVSYMIDAPGQYAALRMQLQDEQAVNHLQTTVVNLFGGQLVFYVPAYRFAEDVTIRATRVLDASPPRVGSLVAPVFKVDFVDSNGRSVEPLGPLDMQLEMSKNLPSIRTGLIRAQTGSSSGSAWQYLGRNDGFSSGIIDGSIYTTGTYSAVYVQDKPILIDSLKNWAAQQIDQLVVSHQLHGYPDGTFKPDQLVTREQLAVMMFRVFGWKRQQANLYFLDSSKIASWAQPAVMTAVAKGILRGYPGYKLHPQDPVTRAEMAVMINRAVNLPTLYMRPSFRDASNLPLFARDSLYNLAMASALHYGAPEEVKPQEKVTRAEAAYTLARVLDALHQ